VPNEVDFAFFLDRVTHLGGPPDDQGSTAAVLSRCMEGETGALNGNAGRAALFGKVTAPRAPA